MLNNKTVILGITGSIAAYKAADIASKLTQAGAKVEVVMTEPATRFITPLTLRAITGRAVVTDMFDMDSQHSIEHIALGEAADVVVIAPATASIIHQLFTLFNVWSGHPAPGKKKAGACGGAGCSVVRRFGIFLDADRHIKDVC